MYYKLSNYYQNHRRYVQSLDSNQLKGDAQSYHTIKGGDCKPLDVTDGKPYYPCGLIANSYFNGAFRNHLLSLIHNEQGLNFDSQTDSYSQPVLLNPSGGASNQTYNMTEKGIAWPGEGDKYQKTSYKPEDVAVPPFWVESYPGGYTNSGLPDIHADEHFWVWMRAAGLPTFRKLWQKNTDEDMQAGTYSIDIYMSKSFSPPRVLQSSTTHSASLFPQTTPLPTSQEPRVLSSAQYRGLEAAIPSLASPTLLWPASASSSAWP